MRVHVKLDLNDRPFNLFELRPPPRRPIRRQACPFVLFLLPLPLLLLLGVGACRVPEPLPEPTLRYEFTWLDQKRPSVQVDLITSGSPEGSTRFQIQKNWAGVADTRPSIDDVRAEGEGGRALECFQTQSHSWEVFHRPGEVIKLSYRLKQAVPWNKHPDSYFQVRVAKDAFHMIGHVGLIHPADLAPGRFCRISVAWHGFDEKNLQVVSSFSPDPKGFETRTTLGRLLHSLFIAGDLRLYPALIEGNTIQFAIHGSWSFSDIDFVRLTEGIMRAQRGFFRDHSQPYYLVSLFDVPDKFNLGGTGLTDSFALFVGHGYRLNDGSHNAVELKHLIAHELFHNWNGGRIVSGEQEELIYWFSEGFTDYYARRTLLEAGLIDRKQYAESLNRLFAEYMLSTANHVPNSRIAQEYWSNRDIKEIPYKRGDIVALLLDRELRLRPSGGQRLDDLMRQIVNRIKEGGQLVTTPLLLDLFGEHVSRKFIDHLRQVVIQGAPPRIPLDLALPDASLTMVPMGRYDLGFDFDASRSTKRVQGLESSSRAYASGLRNGQRLLGWSMWEGDVTRSVQLTIFDRGVRRQIEYLPQSSQTLLVPKFRATD